MQYELIICIPDAVEEYKLVILLIDGMFLIILLYFDYKFSLLRA